jgi:universal stress protein A
VPKMASMKTEVMLDRADSTPLNLKKILVPSDFSPASSKAFKYALRFAKQFGADLTLLHVLEPAPPSLMGITPSPGFFESELVNAEKNFRAWIASARAVGVIKAQSTVRTGLAAHEILEAAKELDVDLIVIATHGFSGWKHFCIGSTAERVARSAPCPVLVVREKEHEFI